MTTPADSPRTIKASEFKATCLKLMDEVAETGEEIIITKNGKPVAKLTPHQKERQTLYGKGRDRMRILGDLDEPMDVLWQAEQGLIDGQ